MENTNRRKVMETIKVCFYVPRPPDGYKVVYESTCYVGDLVLHENQWVPMGPNNFNRLHARRRQTLADWANQQPDFQAFARWRKNYGARLRHSHAYIWGYSDFNGHGRGDLDMGQPPTEFHGQSITLHNGKWEGVT
jgi:hypothetical protein